MPTGSEPPSNRKDARRRAREQDLCDLALGLLEKEGYLGLTMDKLADRAGYAKGTLYLHFKNKEDLICALLQKFQERRMQLFDRVEALDHLSTRGHMLALGLAAEAFVLAYPENARLEPMLKMSSLREKASPERREALHQIEGRCFERVLHCVQDGQAKGDLPQQSESASLALVTGLWGLHVGLNVLSSLGRAACPIPLDRDCPSPMTAMMPVAEHLLDGYLWKPLSTEFDYPSLRKNLIAEHFQGEAQMAQKKSGQPFR